MFYRRWSISPREAEHKSLSLWFDCKNEQTAWRCSARGRSRWDREAFYLQNSATHAAALANTVNWNWNHWVKSGQLNLDKGSVTLWSFCPVWLSHVQPTFITCCASIWSLNIFSCCRTVQTEPTQPSKKKRKKHQIKTSSWCAKGQLQEGLLLFGSTSSYWSCGAQRTPFTWDISLKMLNSNLREQHYSWSSAPSLLTNTSKCLNSIC